jgi:NTP pyrophosphatase (non-canonical NTP hydrolase)
MSNNSIRTPEQIHYSKNMWADVYDNDATLCDLGMSLAHLCEKTHDQARVAGWWSDLETGEPTKRNVGEALCLIHSEISEAMEAHRKNKADSHLPHRPGIEVELADAVIRIMDLSGGLGLDLAGAIVEKLAYNKRRADHQIENRRATDGKRY